MTAPAIHEAPPPPNAGVHPFPPSSPEPEGLATIGGSAFRGCSSVSSVTTLPRGTHTAIGDYAFYERDYISLSCILIPEGLTDLAIRGACLRRLHDSVAAPALPPASLVSCITSASSRCCLPGRALARIRGIAPCVFEPRASIVAHLDLILAPVREETTDVTLLKRRATTHNATASSEEEERGAKRRGTPSSVRDRTQIVGGAHARTRARAQSQHQLEPTSNLEGC